MVVQPYWVTPQLAIVPRPRGDDWLDDEMAAMRVAGIDIVISMLEDFEARELGLQYEKTAAESADIRYIGHPIPDRNIPNLLRFTQFLAGLEKEVADGKHIGVHCRACIGRSSVVIASLLIRSGIPAVEAWKQIEVARGSPVPDTLAQLEWVDQNMRPLE
jgi:protein-tyrosine phosphatase